MKTETPIMLNRTVLVVLFAIWANVDADNWQEVDSATLKQLLSDLTVFYSNSFTVYFAPDGTQRGRWNDFTYTGEWKVTRKGYLCTRWHNWDSVGKEWGCWSVQINGQKMNFVPTEGRAVDYHKMMVYTKGNIEDL